LFRGGWADVELCRIPGPDELTIEAPDVPDVEAFGRLLDEFFARLEALARPT
jgi:hypothetical protein